MKKYFLVLGILYISLTASSQTFISAGTIEFEVKVNVHKAMGEDNIWGEMARENMPKFSVTYYDFVFNGNSSVYKFNRQDEKTKSTWMDREAENNIWFSDFGAQKTVKQKSIAGDIYIISDSLKKIDWKITNESSIIAGFNCRKAVGKIFDSVYVFAFYTDEVMISGGPMALNGLPGMILGVTIPRMHTSWIASSLKLDYDARTISAPSKGKKKNGTELTSLLKDVTKDWRGWRDRFLWNALL